MVDRQIRQAAQVDEKLNKKDYFLGSINPLNDMMGDFKRIVNATNPDALDNGARSYAMCRNNMDSTASLLADSAKRLAENWKGEAADAALKKLREMYDSCKEVWETSEKSSLALSEQAAVLRRYRAVANTPGFDSGDDTAKVMTLLNPAGGVLFAGTKNEMAQHLMGELNQDTSNSNDRFPSYMRTDVPAMSVDEEGLKKKRMPDFPGGGNPGGGSGPGGGAGSANLPKAQFPDGSGSNPPGFGADVPSGTLPGGNDPSSRFPGSGGGSGLNFPGGSGSGLGDTGLAGFNPAGGAGGGLGGGAGAGIDPFSGGTGSGAGGAGLNTGSAGMGTPGGLLGRGLGSGSTGSGGRGMMPMAPHAGGQGDEKERERSTWLTEEEDVWSAGDDAAPPVIG